MSYHVYISKSGFKETPISTDAWLAAARQCKELVVEEKKNKHGQNYYNIFLKGDRRAWLDRSPYGLIVAQDPSKDLISVMFALAGILGAEVYSERLKKYVSVQDWELRTKKYRQSRDDSRLKFRSASRRKLIFWIILIITAIAWGFLTGGR